MDIMQGKKINHFWRFLLCSMYFTCINHSAAQPVPGGPIEGLTASELAFFNEGLDAFKQVESVQGTEPGARDGGLGPRFNLNSCAGCHSHPVVGGTSPPMNPQVSVATQFGAKNVIPFFVKINGPVREARFVLKPSGERDGGVHNLYVITGRSDAVGCNISQPDFEFQRRSKNIVFRIPTPLFGAGLIEAIPDSTILANATNNLELKKQLGIAGHVNHVRLAGGENRSGNDGTISRFGWKAQNKSLLMFSGEAYNVEQGVSNELFPSERDETQGCVFNSTPEDHTRLDASTPLETPSDIELFASFMRFLAPLESLPMTPSAKHGSQLFLSVGCSQCHTPTMQTGKSSIPALSNQPVNLFSDLMLHAMGPKLADKIVQGDADVDEFRTAPLWGLSRRLFFLHDGRTNDLTQAILEHASTSNDPNCQNNQQGRGSDGISCSSEANGVIQNFNSLGESDKQDLLNFLLSL